MLADTLATSALSQHALEDEPVDNRIFISYRSLESGFARELADCLRKAAFSVWLDEEQIPPGRPFRSEIDRGLRDCAGAVFVVSPEWLKSNWTEYELDVFARVGPTRPRIALLRFRRGDHQLPPELSSLENIEWLNDSDRYACFWKLVCGLRGQSPGPARTWSRSGRETLRGVNAPGALPGTTLAPGVAELESLFAVTSSHEARALGQQGVSLFMARRFDSARRKFSEASALQPSVAGLLVLECAAQLGESSMRSLSLRSADELNKRLIEARTAQDPKVVSTASLLLSVLRVDCYDAKNWQAHGIDSAALLSEVVQRPRTAAEREVLSRLPLSRNALKLFEKV